jgi:hypothetical protein
MAHWHAREVMNEVEARLRNESIEEIESLVGASLRLLEFGCECGYRGCAAAIHMTRDEYESVRSDGTRFAIAVNHENPEIDVLVAENVRFATVQKWLGLARSMANDSDPRR